MDFNSLDAQRDSCEKYIQIQKHEGWTLIPENYDDGGFSGGNTDRPALKRLIHDIENGMIDVVVVYKIDRLSRSLLDFLNLMQVFDSKKVAFVSVTQNFDTSTSMGKLMLNVLLSFAQFEREITGERIRDKFAASKRKGIWMGGPPAMGYDCKERKLVINQEEAEILRLVFDQFILKRSVRLAVQALRQMGVRTKFRITGNGKEVGGNLFDVGTVYKMLNNPVYIGKIRHKDQIYDGLHEPIISQETWDAAQNILKISPRVRGNSTKRKVPAVLLGILKCGGCGSSMSPKHAKKKNGKLYRYYVPSAHMKGSCETCPIKQLAANEIEAVVLSQLQSIFQTPEMIVQVWKKVTGENNRATEEDVRQALSDIFLIWKELFPAEQERLINLMLEKVVVQPHSIDVRIRADGLHSLVRELQNIKVKVEDANARYERAAYQRA
jgi:DNA invertase Pin-like site-specific DNA recombinase